MYNVLNKKYLMHTRSERFMFSVEKKRTVMYLSFIEHTCTVYPQLFTRFLSNI